jgi:hypothetical protein
MAQQTPSPGRWIRAALVLFPLGLIITSILSFGIWWQKKQAVQARTAAFARAMRQDWDEARLEAASVRLQEAWALKEADPMEVAASYMESSMSAESMGYLPRRLRLQAASGALSVVDAEITGLSRPRRVQLLLLPMQSLSKESSLSLATVFALAHSLSGAILPETLRFAMLPMTNPTQRALALQQLASAMAGRSEQLVELTVLGGSLEPEWRREIQTALATAASASRLQWVDAPRDAAVALRVARDLRQRLLKVQGIEPEGEKGSH